MTDRKSLDPNGSVFDPSLLKEGIRGPRADLSVPDNPPNVGSAVMPPASPPIPNADSGNTQAGQPPKSSE